MTSLNTTTRSVVVLAAAVAVTMGAVMGHDLVYDAVALLQRDTRFNPPIDWSGLIGDSYWYSGLWRPATMLLLGVQVHLAGGPVPLLLHTVSLGLYLATAVAFVQVAERLGASHKPALLAGLLFVVHPAHVEVVASVVGQAELLTALAMLGAVALWNRAADRGASAAMFLGLVVLQLLAAGAKEQGYLLSAILLGQQVLLAPRLDRRTAARWLGLLLLLAVTMWLFRSNVTGSLAGEAPAPYFLGVSPLERILAALGVLPRALMMVVFPVNLGLEYGPPAIAIDGRFGWLQAGGLAIIAITIWVLLKWRTRHPLAACGIWFAAITWLPASSLIVPAGLLLADRVLFLPTIGITISLASLPWPVLPRRARAVALGAAAIVIALVLISRERIAVWRDEAIFHAALTRDNPGSYRSWFVAAMHQKHAGNSVAAEQQLRQALSLWQGDPRVHEELGQLLRANGRCAEAIPIMRAGLQLDPERHQLAAKLAECERQVRDTGAEVAG